MNDFIKSIVLKLNNNTITRELVMIPLILLRDKTIDLMNIKFIRKGQKGIKKYRDIHIGKRCFVIGNGPSLTPQDLDLIKDEICFGANRIYDIYPLTEWRPTYYGVQDIYVLEEISEEIEEEENASRVRFIVSNRPNVMSSRMKENPKNEFFYLGECLSENRAIKFTKDFSKTVGHGGTITYAMIQLAIYMGFKEIYLLGVDNSYKNFISNDGTYDKTAHDGSHFAGSRGYKKIKTCNVTLKKGNSYIPTKAYQRAEDYSRMNGIRIYNATRGGCLEVFERVNLEDIL